MMIGQLWGVATLIALTAARYPFAVGETLRYEARLGPVPIGGVTLTVAETAIERGDETFVLRLTGEGGPPGVKARYDLTSWVGVDQFTSRRFHRRAAYPNRVDEKRWVIVPDSARYREEGQRQAWVSPSDPLDELAFLYYLRTVRLDPGVTYSVPRYFRTGYNPVLVRATGRESLELPDGRSVPCTVVSVTSAGNTAQVWLSHDARRLPVQVEAPLEWGTVRFRLIGVGTDR